MSNSVLNINVDLNTATLCRDYAFHGDEKAVGIQLGKMLAEEESFARMMAVALVKYHEINGEYTREEAAIRMEIALDDFEEVLNGML